MSIARCACTNVALTCCVWRRAALALSPSEGAPSGQQQLQPQGQSEQEQQQQQGQQQSQQQDQQGQQGQQESGGLVGLFPLFSFFNHSCSPNACYMVVDDAMVVRASTDVKVGEQLLISYIGPRVLQPLEQRREYLESSYGFECRCPRCLFEAALPAELSAHIALAFKGCERLQRAAIVALGRKDLAGAHSVDRSLFLAGQLLQEQAAQLRLPVEQAEAHGADAASAAVGHDSGLAAGSSGAGGGGGSGITPHTRDVSVQELRWLEASLWRVQELQQGLFGYDLVPESLAAAAETVAAVAAGSDLHVSLAAKQLVTALHLLQASDPTVPGPQAQRRGTKGGANGARRAARAGASSEELEELREAVQEGVEVFRAALVATYGAGLRPATFKGLATARLEQKGCGQQDLEACLAALGLAGRG